MGDRACINLVVTAEDGGLSLYTHWGGHDYAATAAAALEAAKPRWSSDSYFVRIFIDQFFKENRDQETGAGILPGLDRFESEHPRLTIDLPKKVVFIGEQDYGDHPMSGRARTFDDFIKDTELHDLLQGS